jgi:site-specific DNA-methyltransferase (cytosine-N4-specific)
MRVEFLWHAYKYFPYERVLAERELTALLRNRPVTAPSSLRLEKARGWQRAAIRATYFQEAVCEDGRRVIPQQALLEASANGSCGDSLPGFEEHVSLRKQSTRYSAHGLHEYRGKFNPQVVRAIGNVLQLQIGAWVLDPFCGSGTSLLEAAHIGWNAIGIDQNPLAALIANVKITATTMPLEDLSLAAETLRGRLLNRVRGVSFACAFGPDVSREVAGDEWESHLPSLHYLRSWFTQSVLAQISAILQEVDALPSEGIRGVFRVILSDILRGVSLQDPGDLRIRRRKSHEENRPVIPVFLQTVDERIALIAKARKYIAKLPVKQQAICGDARKCVSLVRRCAGGAFDAAITSPPYATALPYIDTQRLSLVVLGLAEASEIRVFEKALIGNREILESERREGDRALSINSAGLPRDCSDFCLQLLNSVRGASDGFRRRNMPTLVYKYLCDMKSVFGEVRQLLKSGGRFALVVGPNRARLGGRDFLIDTPRLLVSVARSKGFSLDEEIPLDTYQRFDIHRSNSIRKEMLLILRTD